MPKYLPLIFGMMAVTYLPRVLPLIALSERPLPPKLKRFLQYIPFTALSALLIRGIINHGDISFSISLAGISAAAIVAWLKGGLVLAVIATISVTYLLLNFCQ